MTLITVEMYFHPSIKINGEKDERNVVYGVSIVKFSRIMIENRNFT